MMTEGLDNRAEIDKARRRYGRTRAWYYGWVAVMCLSPFACFSSMGNHQSSFGFGLMMFGIIAPLVAFGGLLLMMSDSYRSRRRVRLAEEFDLMGFEYIDQPEMPKLAFLNKFPVCSPARTRRRRRAWAGATTARRSSWRWTSRAAGATAKGPKTLWQTILVLTDAAKDVPGMLVEPLGFWGNSASLKVKGEEEFNRAYSLASKWFEEAPRFISRKLAALCLDEKPVGFEVRNGDLMVFWRGKLLEPKKLLDSLKVAVEIARLLRSRSA